MQTFNTKEAIRALVTSKHEDMDLGLALIKYIAGDQVNKIEAQKHRGLDNTRNEKLSDFLDRSDFKRERKIAGEYVSLYGTVNVALLYIDGKYYNTFLKASTSFKKFKRDYVEFVGQPLIGARKHQYMIGNGNNVESDIFWSFKIEDIKGKGKRVVRTSQFKHSVTGKFENIPDAEPFIYPKEVQKIPVRELPNNAAGESDWLRVSSLLKTMDTLSNDLAKEWERTKTMFNVNQLFSNGVNGNDIAKMMDNGSFIYGDSGHSNSKLGGNIQPIISGSVSIQNLIFALQYMEDKVLKLSFQGRDLDGSGTNKHGLQVGLFGQSASEYIFRKKQMREDALTSYFKDIVAPMAGIPLSKDFKVTIDDSLFEQGKVAGMLAEKENARLSNAQAAQMNASRKKIEKDIDQVVANTQKTIVETKNTAKQGFNNQTISKKAGEENSDNTENTE